MKKHFLTGLVLLLPLVLTIVVIVLIIDLFTTPFVDIVKDFIYRFAKTHPLIKSDGAIQIIARIISLILIILVIFLLGMITRWFFFRSILKSMNWIFLKIPLVKTIYKISKDIASALFGGEGSKAFKRSVLVPFASANSFCIGFETGDIPEVCQKSVDTKLVPVFVPTAPHPISGYLLMIAEGDVKSVEMTNEDAVKFTVSCGMILPEKKQQIKHEE